MTENQSKPITMYSTSWCPDCIRARMVLKKMKAPFSEIDIDKDQEGYQVVVNHNGGNRVVPTIFFPDGSTLVEPSNKALIDKITELGLVSE